MMTVCVDGQSFFLEHGDRALLIIAKMLSGWFLFVIAMMV
jgi:hypothetical protein